MGVQTCQEPLLFAFLSSCVLSTSATGSGLCIHTNMTVRDAIAATITFLFEKHYASNTPAVICSRTQLLTPTREEGKKGEREKKKRLSLLVLLKDQIMLKVINKWYTFEWISKW